MITSRLNDPTSWLPADGYVELVPWADRLWFEAFEDGAVDLVVAAKGREFREPIGDDGPLAALARAKREMRGTLH